MDVLQTSLAVADASPGLAVLVDRSCRSCVPCREGSPLWCVDPLTEGRPLVAPVPVAAAEHLCSVVLAAAALMAAPPSDTVVVAALETSPLLLLVRAVTGARVLAGPDLIDRELRAELARLEPSGRAPVLVANADVRSAVRAVRRGGHVCATHVTGEGSTMPSVTELVQREVTLVAPQRVTDVLERVTPPDWVAVVTAA